MFMQHEVLTAVSAENGTESLHLAANLNMSTSRVAKERYFESTDGSSLFYRFWPPVNGPVGPAIILLHRGHEHSGRVQHIVDELNLPGFAMFAWDARGHGLSASAPTGGFATIIKDLDAFVHHVSSSYAIPMESIAVLGQSVGSVVAATWAHDYAPQIRCMVLGTPAFRIKLYAPLAWPALRLIYRLHGDFRINSYIKPRVLTHDPERIASYKADPLITRPISVRVLLELEQASARVLADAQAISVPTQILVSGRDWVVETRPQIEFFERLGTQVKELHSFPGYYHDVLGEQDRVQALDRVRQFILAMFVRPCRRPCLLDADNNGHTRAEFDALSRPLPLLSRKRFRLGLIKLGLNVGSRFSPGIRLGFKTGFDSGSTLDYVYCNRPSGATPIRRLIDRSYLNSIGWKGIRRRKENLVQALLDSAARLRAHNMPVRIVDIAAGHGRYVLEALERCSVEAEDVLLRDLSETNVLLGQMLAQEKKLSGKVRFETGDAFNRESLAKLSPRPTLAVVSGLYELFPENRPVCGSLAGLAEAIEPGGFLVYTGQPFHPQIEMIARTLPSHRGFCPWVMRRRTQAEIDQLVEAAGFRKIGQQIDDWGIFSVSVAQRVAA
jgi:alpha-beta hydrolase superfamily lysophospholipase/SAM-dependent methyltransferase